MVFSYKIVFSLQFHCVVFTNNYNLTLAANDLTRSWHNSLWPTEELETYAVVCIGYRLHRGWKEIVPKAIAYKMHNYRWVNRTCTCTCLYISNNHIRKQPHIHEDTTPNLCTHRPFVFHYEYQILCTIVSHKMKLLLKRKPELMTIFRVRCENLFSTAYYAMTNIICSCTYKSINHQFRGVKSKRI